MTLAHASTKTLVTFETLYDEALLADEKMAAGTIPSIYVSGLAEELKGRMAYSLAAHYERDAGHIRRYVELASSNEGFQQYLMEYVYPQIAAE